MTGVSFDNTNSPSSNLSRELNIDESRNDVEFQAVQPDAVLSILFKNGRIAASYYRIQEKMIYVLNEMTDLQPQFVAMRTLVHEVNPLYIVTLGNSCELYVKALIDMITVRDTTSRESDHIQLVPNNLFLLPPKEYSYNNCEYRVKQLHLMSEPDNMEDEERYIYLNSLVNFQSKMTIHTLGTLIKFTEKSWAHINTANNDRLSFYHIKQISLMDNVFIDKNTINALQIFQKMTHDASFKRGSLSTSREGLSIFRLFSQHCQSKIGYIKLRQLLQNPVNNETELNKRLDFINFANKSNNKHFIESLQDNIKNIADVSVILGKIEHSRGSNRDWDTLYKTVYNILFLNELCGPYRDQSTIFKELANSISENLYGLERCIDNTFDFKAIIKNNRPVIKTGLDSTLDKNKMISEDISTNVTSTAKKVVNQLPSYLNECTVVYIPDMGHVVAVKKWESNCRKTDLIDFGFQFMFELNQHFHYKNALCEELDRYLVYIQNQILEHENRIIERVASFLLRYNNKITEPIEIIGLIDCLISMAKVASEKEYTRPKFNQNNNHEIIEGRHPLLELTNTSYVTNEFLSGGIHSRIKIITGPNASGKSVYMKQTAIIIYLAHIGSYIPASSANIGFVYSIHSRMNATESAILHLSSFMIDLTQMSQALYNARTSSLVLLDEVGRGTTGFEGVALLMGALQKFMNQQHVCPHVLVSTHFTLRKDLMDNSIILYQNMEFTRDITTREIVFLFKAINGISSSYAIEIASAIELDKTIILRATNIVKMYDDYTDFDNIRNLNNKTHQICNNEELSSLLNIYIPEPDI